MDCRSWIFQLLFRKDKNPVCAWGKPKIARLLGINHKRHHNKSKLKTKIMKNLIVLLGVMAIVPLVILYSSFSWGWVASVMMKWYIIPVFPDFPILSWMQLAGIMFFVQCFTYSPKTQVKDEYENKTAHTTSVLLAPWLTLLCAWVFHLFY